MAHPRPIPSLPSSCQNSHLVRVALLFLLASCSRGGWPQPRPNGGRALTGLSDLGGSIPLTTRLKLGCAQSLSLVWLFATPWPVDRQAPLSMGFSWQEYWSGLPFPPPGDLPDPGIKTYVSCGSCIGRQILYHWCSLGLWPNSGEWHVWLTGCLLGGFWWRFFCSFKTLFMAVLCWLSILCIFIYLTLSGLNCGMQDLQLWWAG